MKKPSFNRSGVVFALCLLVTGTTWAQGVRLVQDINAQPTGYGSTPQSLIEVGNTLYFTAVHPQFGAELFKSDGTAAGTVLVKDINPGLGDAFLYDTRVDGGGVLYFTADDGVHGKELWKSDGTAAGTVMVKDINPGSGDAFDYGMGFLAVNGILYFSANDGVHGMEPWRSDGTAAGTTLIQDINPGLNGSYVGFPVNLNGTVCFAADDGSHGVELWRTDGTSAGTVMVMDLNPAGDGMPSYYGPRVFNGLLFFPGDNGSTGLELWRSDGTAEGTVLVKDINPGRNGSSPGAFVALGGSIFFGAGDGTNGHELWKSDGTSDGTVLVKDLVPGSGSSYPDPWLEMGGTLLFSAYTPNGAQRLWRTDGTDAGTEMFTHTSSSGFPKLMDGIVFFTSSDTNGYELWRSDGTDAGTLLVKDINPGTASSFPYDLVAMNGELFFAAADGVHGTELWKSDGTAAGTSLVVAMGGGTLGSLPANFAVLGSEALFSADDGIHGIELWKSDGTPAGTVLVKDINVQGAGPASSIGSEGGSSTAPLLLTVGDQVFFFADDGIHGEELWRSDGSEIGTALVKDINPGSSGSFPAGGDGSPIWTAVDRTLFFVADDGVQGLQLWKSDGTEAGTTLVRVIGIGDSWFWSERNLVNIGGTVFFAASDDVNGSELWKSDGTPSGTAMVKEIVPGQNGSSPHGLVNVDGTLFFFAGDGTTVPNGLWKSDGTSAGTVLVKSDASASWMMPVGMDPPYTSFGGRYFFIAQTAEAGDELWTSDGTAAGTILLKDIQPGSMGSDLRRFTVVNNALFFFADDGVHGDELWKTDGTPAGTVLVKDVNPGEFGTEPPPPYGRLVGSAYGTFFFSADLGLGPTLWKSDGTPAGTVMVEGSRLTSQFGSSGSLSAQMVALGGTLLFAADASAAGAELFAASAVPSQLTIYQQPKDQAIGLGQTVVLTVGAIGPHPVTYQWKLNGVDIPGATGAQHSIPNTQASHFGAYTVLVSDGVTSLLSNPALVSQEEGTTLANALDQASLFWSSAGNSIWYYQTEVTHDGKDAAASGTISDSQQSWLETTVTGPGTLGYWWKVSSEEGFDFLEFYLDDVRQSGQISGSVDWQYRTHSIGGGQHTLRWRYAKDGVESAGADRGWVDQITFQSEWPDNDLFADRILLSGPAASVTGSNQGATKEPGEPDHAGNFGGRSVWWSWTAPGSGIIRMDTVGSSFDTLLAVYVGTTLSDLVPVAFDDEGGTNGLSLLTFHAVLGTTYHIAVDGWEGGIGDIVLNVGPGVATAPYFTFPLPPSEMRFEGGRLDLQVYPGGTAPLTYQWFKDNTPLPGATNSLLVLLNLRIDQTGDYTVVVANAVGAATNPPFHLRVAANTGLAPVSVAGRTYVYTVTEASKPEAIGTSLATAYSEDTFALPARGVYPAEWGFYTYQKTDQDKALATSVTTNPPVAGLQRNINLVFETPFSGTFSYLSFTPSGGQDESGSGVFRLLSPRLVVPPEAMLILGTQGFKFVIYLGEGRHARVQGSTDLSSWLDLTNFIGAGVPFEFLDRAATNLPRRFYRVVSP